ERSQWNVVARLGSRGFETISGEGVNAVLISLSRNVPSQGHKIFGIDVSDQPTVPDKAEALTNATSIDISQASQLKNPDARITLDEAGDTELLQVYADAYIGQRTGDVPQFIVDFWELRTCSSGWVAFGTTVEDTIAFGGGSQLLLWEDGKGQL